VLSLNAATYLGVLWVNCTVESEPPHTRPIERPCPCAIRGGGFGTTNAPGDSTVLVTDRMLMFSQARFGASAHIPLNELRRSATLYGLSYCLWLRQCWGALALQRTRSLFSV